MADQVLSVPGAVSTSKASAVNVATAGTFRGLHGEGLVGPGKKSAFTPLSDKFLLLDFFFLFQ